ncbi:cadherin repeat domain-containing protein, partial [Vibrio brasiliensis]
TIQDSGENGGNDDRPVITEITGGVVEEGELASFDVTLSNVSELATPITLSLADGTAEAASDYTATTVTVTYTENGVEKSQDVTVDSNGDFTFNLPAGNEGFKVEVQTTDDDQNPVYEGDETFTLTGATEAQAEANDSKSGTA